MGYSCENVNLLEFKPEKLSIETKSNSNNDIKVIK